MISKVYPVFNIKTYVNDLKFQGFITLIIKLLLCYGEFISSFFYV